MAKQVKATIEAVVEEVPASTEQSEPTPGNNPQNIKTRYVKVLNYEKGTGKTLGERIVDMFHIGTRNFIQNNLWWATSNGHDTEIVMVGDEEVGAYMAKRRLDLVDKFGGPKTNKAAEPAVVAA